MIAVVSGYGEGVKGLFVAKKCAIFLPVAFGGVVHSQLQHAIGNDLADD